LVEDGERRGLQRYHVRAGAEGVAVHVNEHVDAVGVDCERHLRVAEVMQIAKKKKYM
jgi:hypothetical protein